MPSEPIRAVLLSGRSGVGKSSVAYEITHQLSERNVAHVHIDGDNLDAIHPSEPGSALMLANLRALWTNFVTLRGARTLLLSGTGMVLEHAAIRQVLEDVCGCHPEKQHVSVVVTMTAVILTADDATAAARLEQREIGTDLERHLASSKRMAKILGEFEGPPQLKGHRVSTGGREVKDIAEEIIGLAFVQAVG